MNITGSKYEAYVDRLMDSISKKAHALGDYVTTGAGRDRLLMIEKVAAFAIAFLLGMSNATIVLCTAMIGLAVRAFSPEQLKSLDASIAIVWKAMPFHVNALVLVVTMLYTPVIYPTWAGFSVGKVAGAYVSPQKVVNALDTVDVAIQDASKV